MLVYPKDDPNYDTKYDLVSLKNHLETHKQQELIRFVCDEAEDVDNNYYD